MDREVDESDELVIIQIRGGNGEIVKFNELYKDNIGSNGTRVGRFCPLGQNLVVLTRLKPSCPKPLGWTKLDKTSKFNLIHKFTVISKFCPSFVQVLSKCCSWLP